LKNFGLKKDISGNLGGITDVQMETSQKGNLKRGPSFKNKA
jgi:hypothetical protein